MRLWTLCWSMVAMIASLALVAGPISAAEIRVHPARSGGMAVIVVAGELLPDDGQVFAQAAARVAGRALVLLASPGGSLIAGLQIGQVTRLRRFATFVGEQDFCASACAFAWLAGVPRAMQPASRIGFHAAFVETAGTKVESGVGNALAGAYLNNLQLSYDAIAYLEQSHPDEITWLTIRDANRFGIAVKVVASTRPSGEPAPEEPDGGPDPSPPAGPDRPERRPPDAAPAVQTAPPAPVPPHRPLSVLMPELSAPIPPDAEPDAPVEEQARGFVRTYFAHWSETGEEALRYFGESYSSRVAFYGRTIDRDTLLASKRSYTQRWPVRVYTAHPETMRVFCQARTCTLAGVVDWDCRDPVRQAASKGSANFFLTVVLSGGHGEIVAENGSVLSRNAE